MTSNTPLVLTPVEARILGTLMEKARTVPDSYPLSLGALLTGCNQKSSRDPVMELSEPDAVAALDNLTTQNLVRRSSGSRVTRYEHNIQRALGVPEQSAVLLGLLMLRGPQTSGELRINAERWYRFVDISSVEGFLEELRTRPEDRGGALVTQLPRAPGAREQRWGHLLCGAPSPGPTRPAPSSAEERIERLESELAVLRETVRRLCSELGLPP